MRDGDGGADREWREEKVRSQFTYRGKHVTRKALSLSIALKFAYE